MTWENHTFNTSEELIEYANENNIKFSRDDSQVIQDMMGKWHLFSEAA